MPRCPGTCAPAPQVFFVLLALCQLAVSELARHLEGRKAVDHMPINLAVLCAAGAVWMLVKVRPEQPGAGCGGGWRPGQWVPSRVAGWEVVQAGHAREQPCRRQGVCCRCRPIAFAAHATGANQVWPCCWPVPPTGGPAVVLHLAGE